MHPGLVFALVSLMFCAVMVAFAVLWTVRPILGVLTAVLLTIWSAAAWAVPPSIQSMMLARAGTEAASQAMAVHSSSVYIGAALGGIAGGGAFSAGLGLVSAAAAGLAFLALVIMLSATRSRTAGPAKKSEVSTEREY